MCVYIIKKPIIKYFRALTKHLVPPITSLPTQEMEISNVESVQILVNMQNEEINRLMNIIKIISPQLFGSDALRTVNNGNIFLHNKFRV